MLSKLIRPICGMLFSVVGWRSENSVKFCGIMHIM